jgi:DNA modification methylase
MAEIIKFFTKAGEEVLDPFAGVGGTLLGAALCGRRALGFEINQEWVDIYHRIQREFAVLDGRLVPLSEIGEDSQEFTAINAPMVVGDCMQRMAGLPDASMDAIIADPPYGCQHGATGFRNETNFQMTPVADPRDYSNAEDISEFLERIEAFGCHAWRILRPGRYLVLMVGDRYMRGEFVPLGVMVAESLRRLGFRFKGMRIWWNKATQRPLKPYAVKTCFVPNIVHQNILVLRRDEE